MKSGALLSVIKKFQNMERMWKRTNLSHLQSTDMYRQCDTSKLRTSRYIHTQHTLHIYQFHPQGALSMEERDRRHHWQRPDTWACKLCISRDLFWVLQSQLAASSKHGRLHIMQQCTSKGEPGPHNSWLTKHQYVKLLHKMCTTHMYCWAYFARQ